MRLANGDIDVRRMIEGRVLIWEEGGIRYRLKTDPSLEEAVTIAQPLK